MEKFYYIYFESELFIREKNRTLLEKITETGRIVPCSEGGKGNCSVNVDTNLYKSLGSSFITKETGEEEKSDALSTR